MARNDLTRRRVLRTGGAVVAAGTVASSAGCLGSISLGGGWAYRNWLHAPGELDNEREHYEFSVAQPKAIFGKEDHLSSEYVSQYEDSGIIGDLTGIEIEDVMHAISWSGFILVKGTGMGDVVEELEDNDFEKDSDYGGYTIYVNENERDRGYAYGFAVKGGHFVMRHGGGGDPDTTVDHLETAIDTRNGDETRYVEDNEAMGVLTDTLGLKHEVSGRTHEEVDESNPETGRFSGQVAVGHSIQIRGENSRVRRVFVFEDDGDASDADVGDWADAREDGQGTWSEADSIDTKVTGRAAVVTATIPSDEL